MARVQTKTGGRAETSGIIPGDCALSVGMPDKPAPEGWSWVKLTDVARLETGHTPSRKHPEYWGGDVPWVGIKDATGNHGETIFKTNQYTNELGISNSSARILPAHTVCLSRTASVGYVIVMGVPMSTSQDFVNWVCDENKLDYNYLRYVLLAENASYARFSSGTTHQTIYFPEVKAFHICMPEIGKQKAISGVLRTLDKKIALNRQINTTLESMAQALFKSWFVDFDPVIDNALAAGNEIPDALQKRAAARAARREALRQQINKTTGATDADSSEQALPETGLSEQRLPSEIQQLFPDRFVLTEEMGWVPEGWGIESLDRIASYQNGLALQKFRPEDENDFLPVVKIAQLKKGYADGEEKASPNIKPECIIDDGDVVFSWSGSLMVDVWCGGRAALNQHLFKVTSDEYPKWFFLHFTLHHLAEFQRIAADKAVTMGHIKREHLSQAKCSVPGIDFMEKLSPFFDPLLNKAVLSRLENRALADLRDSLLPKLLSGQITIPDAEQQLAEVL